jgi:hypothetical protein
MNAQPNRLNSYTQERIIAVPLRAAGAGLRLLLKTGLVPAAILGLRFVCALDSGKDRGIQVVVNVGRTRGGLPCALAPEIRGALEQCFCRFVIRSRHFPLGTLLDIWEWDSRRDILIRRRHRKGEACSIEGEQVQKNSNG